MPRYEFEPPQNFLGLPPDASSFDRSAVVVLPVPYELSTSYGGGTRNGPAAILRASAQVELYDRELDDEPALRWGVHTLPALARDLSSPENAVAAVEDAVADLAATGKLVVVLGGEHSLSVGVARGLHRALGDFVTVQLDAHADLRDTYEGTPYSHACAMRRIVELSAVIQVGIRSLDVTEAAFIRENPDRVSTYFAEDVVGREEFAAELAGQVRGKRVFLTIDVDALDPSIMPATGTPEPGGLSWQDTVSILRTLNREADVIGFDCVELAPIPGLHAPDFLAAKLAYKTMTYVMSRRGS